MSDDPQEMSDDPREMSDDPHKKCLFTHFPSFSP
jgi:hypothetical protein